MSTDGVAGDPIVMNFSKPRLRPKWHRYFWDFAFLPQSVRSSAAYF
jgi:hypothetical protein